uniref:UL16-binding protein 1-like n=1 Tax=Myodes glareolus TaxID=447135 RepID=UPI00201FECFA|nr:UL16-binding protein 1-like [Myodes glareolus]XP_048281343.1 UL16-binding protein 1-like [Myodes glareolus]
MAKPRNSLRNRFQKLSLLVLLICLRTKQLADTAFLCYNSTLKKPTSGPWSQEVIGQLNKQCFIYCYSTNTNCYPNGVLGNRLIATKIWETQVDTLRDLSDLFKQQMIHMKQENNSIREPLSLQARMCCWQEVDGRFNGFWDFVLNGHKMAHVDSSTGEWIEVDPGSRWMKEMWEKNMDFTAFLKMTSQGDCMTWLEEFKSQWEEKLEPTASTTTTPDVDQSSSMANDPKIAVLLIILPYALLLFYVF